MVGDHTGILRAVVLFFDHSNLTAGKENCLVFFIFLTGVKNNYDATDVKFEFEEI